jgi:serine/threonine protein kinase
LTRLNVLDVAYNLLEVVSIELRRLTELASLHLNSNRLEALPDVFDHLPDLGVFLCDKNRLTELPPTLVRLHENAHVNLEDNQLEPTLASLCFLGFSAVREYLQQPDEAKSASAASLRSSFEIEFGRIQLGPELGRGAFGVVHRATLQPEPPRRRYAQPDTTPIAPIIVAVKVLSLRVDQIATEAGRRRFVDDFRRELAMLAKTAQSWSFPASVRRHFVGFYGACTQDPFCLVTEYCERGSLYDMLARYGRRLHSSVRYHVAIEVAEGLHNLHSHTPDAILHHDVKTSNILITQDFAIKLADFGLARVQASTRLAARLAADGNVLSSDDDEDDNDESESEDDRTDSFVGSGGLSTQEKLADPLREALFQSSTGSAFNESASGYDDDGDVYDGKLGESAELDGYDSVSSYYARTGSGGGTCFFVPYAAPEILRGGRYDIAAETFSFGMVLWCLAAGGEPFSGRSLTAIRQAKLSGKPLPSTDRSVDTVFSNLVTRCTAAAREARPSFPSIIAELREARDRLDLRSVVLPDE